VALGAQFEDVLSAARHGAGWALTVLYRELHPRLLRYLRVEVGQDADDVASEVWVNVAEALPRFAGDEAGFRSWVFTIARRRVLDLRRRRTRRRTDPVPADTLESTGDLAVDDIERAVESLAADAALAYLVEQVSPDQAEVVLLRIVGGFNVDETAAIVDKSPGAVRALQHRALNRLAKKISLVP